MSKTLSQEFLKGLWTDIPPFRLVLGLCPTLALTKSAENGLGMGLAVTFVLFFSNSLISLLRTIIPSKVRIACYIVVIATFVVVVELLSQAYFFPVYQAMGIFLPLIVVNCILLGRAEAFSSKNGVLASALDGLGMGLGYTLSLTGLGMFREAFGNGTIFAHPVMPVGFEPMTFLVEAPGAFICLGIVLGLMNYLSNR